MSRKRRGKSRRGGRVEALLDLVKGKPTPGRDTRRSNRWGGSRTLDIKRNRDLFERLVSLDYDFLLGQNFAATQRALGDLLPQSVLGRAQNGHGWFTDEFGVSLQFPDATFERVLTVLEAGDPNLEAGLVRGRRGAMLSRFRDWILERLDTDELELVIDGEPLFGITFLGEARVRTRPFLTGLVLAGYMDDWSYRETSMLQFKRTFTGMPYRIGGGEIMIVDRERFAMCGIQDPGSTVWLEEELRTLRDIGALCRNRHGEYRFPEHDQAFFRRAAGDGVCDDLAIVMVGAEHGFSAMLGAFVMDAVDTYDKYVLDLAWGGWDGRLAGEIQKHFRDKEDRPLVDDRQILDLIHFAAKRNDPPLNLSSSHRRLIQIEPGAAVPTLLNHWRFLQGEPLYDIKLGYSRIPCRVFYETARARLQAYGLDCREPEYIKRSGRDRGSRDA